MYRNMNRESDHAIKDQSIKLPERTLGSTGLKVSLLGLGGFHQCEVDSGIIEQVANRFIALGGNYVETARSYGRGASEIKLGNVLKPYRKKLVIASKTAMRDAENAWRELNETLTALQTDHLDLYFIHNISRMEDANAILAPDGALKTFIRAKDEGMIKHIAISSHWPAILPEIIDLVPFETVLIWGNYLDFCNYPEIPEQILPALRKHGKGILFMKPLADGYLYRSPVNAFRYALRHDCDCIVSGFNSLEMLNIDAAAIAEGPLNDAACAALLTDAPELGNYVCRQCKNCTVLPGSQGNLLKRLFELEGKFDRQMNDYRPVDSGTYALRQRLGGWFGNVERATAMYSENAAEFIKLSAASGLKPCRYHIDIPRKIRIAAKKLSGGNPAEI